MTPFTFKDVPRVQGGGIPPELDRAIRIIREAGQGLEKLVKAMSQVWMSPALSDSDGAAMKIPGPKGKQGQRGRMGQPGRNGEIVQIPVFGQPRDMGKLVLIQSQTASSSATIDFVLNRQPNSKFAGYLVVLTHVIPATDGVDLYLRTSTDAGATYDAGASDYDWAQWRWAANAGTAAVGDTADSEITIAEAQGNATQEMLSGTLFLADPSSANYGTAQWHATYASVSNLLLSVTGSGRRLSAADVDGIRFLYSSGNIASGEFRLYGLLE